MASPNEPSLPTDPKSSPDKNATTHEQGIASGESSELSSKPALERQQTMPSTLATRLRRMSKTFEESDLPEGFLAATGSIASSMVSASGFRRSSADKHGGSGPSSPVQQNGDSVADASRDAGSLPSKRSNTITGSSSPQDVLCPIPDTTETESSVLPNRQAAGLDYTEKGRGDLSTKPSEDDDPMSRTRPRTDTEPFENGYHFPPSHGFAQSMKLGTLTLWKFFLTPVGFFVVLYGLLVVAWGGMLFLLLCGAAPAMCHPTCDDTNSPRMKWIEYDSQIVNALFCVTGFGLAPWRIRDLYFLLQYRILGRWSAVQRLAGIHRGWFRLEGSDQLGNNIGADNIETAFPTGDMPASIPYPAKKIPDAPLTGHRASPTSLWKLDFIIWSYVGNTVMQCVLSGFMWGMNRYDRPSWVVGFSVGLAMVLAAMGGIMVFLEGKKVKGVEGVPLSDADKRRLALDKERNIPHYNNLKDKKPKPENEK